jgi:hypothetical protein
MTQVVFHRCGTELGRTDLGDAVVPASGGGRYVNNRRVSICTAAVVLIVLCGSVVLAQPQAGLTKIAAGTQVDRPAIPLWSHSVLIARPRVAAGDVDAVAEIVIKHAEFLSFVLLARVEQSSDRDPPVSLLRDIGVGLATMIDGRWTVVSGPADLEPQGAGDPPLADLGFIANRVLQSAERTLDDMKIIVRRTTLILYDSPAVINLSGSNQLAVVRSMLWIEPHSGKLHHAMWALQKGQRQPWVAALEQGVYLPVPFEEDRILHVDSRQFRFGIPAATAFALASLPPGYPFSLAGRLGELACQETYNEAELRELAVGLIASLRREATP